MLSENAGFEAGARQFGGLRGRVKAIGGVVVIFIADFGYTTRDQMLIRDKQAVGETNEPEPISVIQANGRQTQIIRKCV